MNFHSTLRLPSILHELRSETSARSSLSLSPARVEVNWRDRRAAFVRLFPRPSDVNSERGPLSRASRDRRVEPISIPFPIAWERFLFLSLSLSRERRIKERNLSPSRFPEFRVEKEREREREGGEYRRSRSQRATFPPLPTPPYVVVVNNVRFDVNLPVSIESNERVAERRRRRARAAMRKLEST